MSVPQHIKLNLTLLVDKLIKSNREAYSHLFNLFWEDMYVHAKSLVQSEQVAKDIVQEIWLDIWNRRTSLRNQNFKAYLHKAVRNNCYKYFRNTPFNTDQLEVIKSLDSVFLSTTEQFHDVEEMKFIVGRAVEKLPKRCQQIFRLSRFEDVPNEQIARKLGISKRTVENQLSRALKTIRETIYAS